MTYTNGQNKIISIVLSVIYMKDTSNLLNSLCPSVYIVDFVLEAMNKISPRPFLFQKEDTLYIASKEGFAWINYTPTARNVSLYPVSS